MKKLIILSLILVSCATYQKVSYSEPFQKVYGDLPGDKNQLFVKANEWMVKTFNSAESVIEYSDKEAGALMGKYLMFNDVNIGYFGNTDIKIYAIIDIRIKDNRAMLSIKPIGEWLYDTSGLSAYKFGNTECQLEMERLSASLEESFKSAPIDF